MEKDEITKAILALAAHPEGVRARDDRLGQWPRTNIDRRLQNMVKAGELHKVFLSPRIVRYYVHERHASLAGTSRAFDCTSKGAKPAGLDKPHGWAQMQGQVTPDTKITQCPNWVDRFVALDLPGWIFGGNQRGRVMVDYEDTQRGGL
jgi:hypothetical protein